MCEKYNTATLCNILHYTAIQQVGKIITERRQEQAYPSCCSESGACKIFVAV